MHLKGKTAFLTGGAGGIGVAFARALLDKGCKVCITDVNADAGKKLETVLRRKYHDDVVFIQCDVTSASNMEDVFKTAVARFGGVDIMLNNAGIMHEGRWEDMISIMMRGTVIGTDLAIAHMRKDKGGRGGVVINTASCAGIYVYFTTPVYCAAKSGVVAYTRAWANIPDREQLGLRFACICPKPVDTPLMDVTQESVNYYQYEYEACQQQGKMKTETIAEGLVGLLEDDGSNGAILYISKDEGFARKKILVVNESDLKHA
ncbi:15-hydroxyprostaglandin dehydrogenase [NAD(+)]-like [Haliotis asinina]|uniref:15-hydroxyprostaglandin dehydrogenase [NAD(+)]-like n=1 Tax=Haliotis asinina TaxID=109174 RepID=UPI00353184B4